MSYKITEYPDGTSYVTIEKEKSFHGLQYSSSFLFRLNSYEDLWHLNQLVDASNHNGVRPTIVIPNLIDAQADRRFAENQSSGLRLVLQFLNTLNADFRIFHPHNAEVVEAIVGNVEIIDNSSFIQNVLLDIGVDFHRDSPRKPLYSNLILMSSDAGGFKPLMRLCDKIKWEGETFSASKARSWDEKDGTKFVQQIDRQDFGGKDILIIDDLSIYGGTFKGLAKLLRERNVGKLYLAVSHMTIENLGKDPVTNYFDHVFTTDSKGFDYHYPIKEGNIVHVKMPDNLTVLNFL